MYYRTVIIFTFLSVLFLLPVNAANLYEWKDENGVMNITSTPPPQNVKKYNVERYRKDTKEEIEQYEKQRTQQQRDAAARTEATRRANQESNNNKSKTPDSAYEMKRKELHDNFNRAYQEYEKEKNERLQRNGKQPSSREISLRAAMFDAQEAEHAFLFSPENFKGTVIQTKITTTRSK